MSGELISNFILLDFILLVFFLVILCYLVYKNYKERINKYNKIIEYRNKHKLNVDKYNSLKVEKKLLEIEILDLKEKRKKYLSCVEYPKFNFNNLGGSALYYPHSYSILIPNLYDVFYDGQPKTKVEKDIDRLKKDVGELRSNRDSLFNDIEEIKVKHLKNSPKLRALLREEEIDKLIN